MTALVLPVQLKSPAAEKLNGVTVVVADACLVGISATISVDKTNTAASATPMKMLRALC
jgi:hypothetical protein